MIYSPPVVQPHPQPLRPHSAGIVQSTTTQRDTRQLASAQLFDGQTEIEIHHGTMVYRLRQTSLGKLILTK